ncbi:phosphotransferase family protein [Nocardioides korecus]
MAETPDAATADPPGLSVAAVEAHLRDRLPGLLHGPLGAELVAGGRSNLTYVLSDGRTRWVLRRPPLGHVLETAHDMAREHRLLAALHPTDVPVPRPVLLGDPEVLGVPFYVMEHADGQVLRSHEQLQGLAGEPAHELAGELVEVLARLHRVDPGAVGLDDLGRPVGYLERQLRRWARQVEASHTRDLPELTRLGDRLGRSVPQDGGAAVVHGDYRLDNVVVDLDAPAGRRVVAVLDWEMATLGDRWADLASAVVWWDGVRGLDLPVAAVPGDVDGFPGAEVLLSAYEGAYEGAGGGSTDRFDWYLAFAFFKIAAIFEGIHFRSRQGLTVGEGFDTLGDLVDPLVERGHAALDGA